LAIDVLSFDLMQLSRFEEARELLEWRVRSGRSRAETRINLALCCEKTGDAALAESWYERALELDPVNVQALTELVRLSAARGDEVAADAWRKRLAEAESQ
jgi:Tfp pilus assembly protein PilF